MALTRSGAPTIIVGALLLAAVCPIASQTQPPGPTPPGYQSGQVWTLNHDVTVTVLAVEDVRKIGRVVHIRIDNIPWQSCGDVHLTRSIEHVAITEKMLLKSGLTLSKEAVGLPESSIDAYRGWQARKKREIAKTPLHEILFPYPFAVGGMICNFIPAQT